MVISFEELRRIKHSLPHGSIHRIAEETGLDDDTVRNFFGGFHFKHGQPVGIHYEKGLSGVLVHIEDEKIIRFAQAIIAEAEKEVAHS
jgi:predicted transcriptional regulator